MALQRKSGPLEVADYEIAIQQGGQFGWHGLEFVVVSTSCGAALERLVAEGCASACAQCHESFHPKLLE